jgi:hypothetical protein
LWCLNAPFNGDPITRKEFIRLRNKFSLNTVVETGTYKGMTTRWFAENFNQVYTIEFNDDYFREASEKLKYPNITFMKGSSESVLLVELLPQLSKQDNVRVIFYLDAHCEQFHPLLDELRAIAKYFPDNCIIVIDDFQVPHTTYGFDQPLGYDYIKSVLPLVYPKGSKWYYIGKSEHPTNQGTGRIHILPKEWDDGSLTTIMDGCVRSNI